MIFQQYTVFGWYVTNDKECLDKNIFYIITGKNVGVPSAPNADKSRRRNAQTGGLRSGYINLAKLVSRSICQFYHTVPEVQSL